MSGMDRSKIIDTLKQRGGFITTGEVKSRGEYEQLRRAIEDGTLMRIRNGVYVEMSALANNMIDVERIVPHGVLCLYSAFWSRLQNEFDTDAILKPSRNSGSRGIAKVSRNMDKGDFIRAYDEALSESRDHSVLIEQFIEGPEFSIEMIVWRGDIHVLTVTDKKTTGAPHFVELGHNQPSCFSATDVETLKAAAVAGVRALGVNNCACHAEAKLMNGKAYLMEVGARLGGDFISTELTHLSTGVDMVAAAIDVALGVEPDLSAKEDPKGVCIRYFCPKPGKLVSISNTEVLNNPHVYLWEIYPKEGDVIPAVTSSLCRSGHVIVTEKTPQKAIELAERLIESVKFETV